MLYKEVAFDPEELLPQKLLTSDNSEDRVPCRITYLILALLMGLVITASEGTLGRIQPRVALCTCNFQRFT